MKFYFKFLLLPIAFFLISSSISAQTKSTLRLIVNLDTNEYGYVNAKGDTVVPFGKYQMSYTYFFDQLAIVRTTDNQLVGIDRKENILFQVYEYDNGPDYFSNGLFRIIKNGKIGYANGDGKIVIPPQYDCAYPFKNGKAKVGNGCKTQNDGEHQRWTGGKWHTINKAGKITK